MNMNPNESKTIAMIKEAMAGVALTRAKCNFYAEKARMDGLDNVARFLEDSARHKDAHYRAMCLTINNYGPTKDNLEDLLASENRIQQMGPIVINTAMQEGFYDLIPKLERLMGVSKDTTNMLSTLINQLEMVNVVKSEHSMWRCRICGNMEAGDFPPAECSVCDSKDCFEELKREILRYVTAR